MKTNEKLRHILDVTGISVRHLCDKQKDLFPKGDRLSYNALTQVFYGDNRPRFSTLVKISQLLEMPILELMEDTEFEDIFFLRRNKRFDSFMYNDKAYADIVTGPKCSFMSMELHIQPGGKTRPERSPADENTKYEKCVYIISGRLRVHINKHEYNLTQRDSITFVSSKPHHFENAFNQKCIALITLSPKHF